MGLQHSMPLLPRDAEMVSEHLAFAREDGRVTFFNASGPIFTYREGDEASLRLAAAMLSEPRLALATPIQLSRVLGRHRSRVHEYRNRYQEGGLEALAVKRPGPHGASKFKGIRVARAQKFLNEGKSRRGVAALVGVSVTTVRDALEEGRLVLPPGPGASSPPSPRSASTSRRCGGDGASEPADVSPVSPEAASAPSPCSDEGAPRRADASPIVPDAASTPRQRSDEDAACLGGVATKREQERALAPTGLLVEAAAQFQPAESVAKAGVLLALPALLGQGLVEVGQRVYGSLKSGYYGR